MHTHHFMNSGILTHRGHCFDAKTPTNAELVPENTAKYRYPEPLQW